MAVMRTAAVNMLEATVVKNEEAAVAAMWQVNHENVRKELVRPYARYGRIGILRADEKVEIAAENQNAVPAAEWRGETTTAVKSDQVCGRRVTERMTPILRCYGSAHVWQEGSRSKGVWP